MPDQQAQAKEKEQPTPSSAMMRYLNELMPFIGRVGATTTIGPDNSIKHSYKMPQEAQQALVGAREGNMPSYKGMDPEDVIALMGQRSKLDEQVRQMPLDMSTMNQQSAYANQLNRQPQEQAAGRQMALLEQLLAGKMQQDNTILQGENQFANQMMLKQTPQAQSALEQDLMKAQAQSYRREPVAKPPSAAMQNIGMKSAVEFQTMHMDKDGKYKVPDRSQLTLFDETIKPLGLETARYAFPAFDPDGRGDYDPMTIDIIVPIGSDAGAAEIYQELIKQGYRPEHAKQVLRNFGSPK